MEEAPLERDGHEGDGSKDELDAANINAPRTRFRFKSKDRSKDSEADKYSSHRSKRRKVNGHESTGHQEEASRPRRRKSRRHMRPRDDVDEGKEPPNPTYEMDTETAFRESLFDALADDEGAAFWEGVYGQPIHTYPNTKPADEDNPDGELEQMSDEEYTAYVRQQMWEKSHQHVIEERRRRAEAAERRREGRSRTSRMESENDAFNRKMEESLKRGEERRREKAWIEGWKRYVRGWENLLDQSKSPGKSEKQEKKGKAIPWPCRSGKAADVGKQEVEAFFEHAALRDASKDSLRAILKVERVRWHPDKMQQRFGGEKIDAETLKTVVAVFQIVDAQFTRL